jgi:hypothetical protein
MTILQLHSHRLNTAAKNKPFLRLLPQVHYLTKSEKGAYLKINNPKYFKITEKEINPKTITENTKWNKMHL